MVAKLLGKPRSFFFRYHSTFQAKVEIPYSMYSRFKKSMREFFLAIFILFLNNPIPSADFMTCDPSMTGRVQNGAFEFMILSDNISYTSSYFF